LAGLLLPALAQAKAKAQSIQCTSNLRQLSLGYRLHIDTDEGKLSNSSFVGNMVWQASSPSDLQKWWVEEWGKTNGGWICPTAPLRAVKPTDPPAGGPPGLRPGTVTSAWSVSGPNANWWW